MVSCGGDGAPAEGDGSSSSGDGDPSSTSAPPSTSAPTSGPQPTSDTGSDSGEASDDSTSDGHMPPMLVGPCEQDPATPAGQTGTPVAVRTWTPQSGIAVITIDGAGNRYVAGTFSAPITFGEMTFDAVVDNTDGTPEEDAFVAALAPDGSLSWLHHFHGDGIGVRPHTIALDANGFLYFGGEFGSSLFVDDMQRGDWPTSGRNAILAKFTAETGEVRWVRPLTGSENEAMITDIVPTSGSNVVAAVEWQGGSWSLNDTTPVATVGGTAWVGLDGNGEADWWSQGTWGQGTSWLGNSSMHAVDGGVLAVFWTEAIAGMTTSVNVGGTDLANDARLVSYIVDVDETGHVRSAEAFQTDGDVVIEDAVVGPCGDLIAVGTWSGDVDFGDGPLGTGGAFVWRRDTDGNTRWITTEPGDHSFNRVAIDANGQVTVAGVDGNIGRATRYSTAGEQLWNTVVDGDVFYGYPESIAIAPDGTTVLGSYFYSLDIPGFDPVPFMEEAAAYMIDLAP